MLTSVMLVCCTPGQLDLPWTQLLLLTVSAQLARRVAVCKQATLDLQASICIKNTSFLVDIVCFCRAGDCAIASSFVSYLGPFNKEFRELLITRDFYGGCVKLKIPVTKDMQVTKFLVDDSEVGEWTLQVH